MGYISDDEQDDDIMVAWGGKRVRINAATKAIAVKWLRMARARGPSDRARSRKRDARRKKPGMLGLKKKRRKKMRRK